MRKSVFFAIVLAGISSGAMPGDEIPVGGPFTFQFRQEGGRFYFDGRFAVDTDAQGAWEVLTDYNNVSRFVANMNCRVLRRAGGDVLVDQTVGGGFLFIRQEVKGLLKIRETPFQSIRLEEVTHKQFGLYQGAWSLSRPDALGNDLTVAYSLQAEKNNATPGFVTAGLFRQAAEDLVIGMKKEMDHRESVRRMNSLKAAKLKAGS